MGVIRLRLGKGILKLHQRRFDAPAGLTEHGRAFFRAALARGYRHDHGPGIRVGVKAEHLDGPEMLHVPVVGVNAVLTAGAQEQQRQDQNKKYPFHGARLLLSGPAISSGRKGSKRSGVRASTCAPAPGRPEDSGDI